MSKYSARLSPSLFIAAAFVLACAHRTAPSSKSGAIRPAAPGTVTADEQARQAAGSLEQMLAGRISGVKVTRAPGGGITVRIGGPTSFYARQDPLFIVDGVPIEGGPNGTLSWLSP